MQLLQLQGRASLLQGFASARLALRTRAVLQGVLLKILTAALVCCQTQVAPATRRRRRLAACKTLAHLPKSAARACSAIQRPRLAVDLRFCTVEAVLQRLCVHCTMVLPLELVEAAKAGNVTAVREWLESGGNPNDTDSRGCTLLLKVVITGEISDAHLDVARLLLSHGADVNKSDTDSFTPVHCCAIFPKQSSRGPLIQLLLDAGADVNAKTSDGETPLAIALGLSGWRSPDDARACLDMVTRLLRAGAALDAIRGQNSSIEDIEDLLREEGHHYDEFPQFCALEALISDVRAAGSTWKGYVRALPKELLRLRSLVARGRAREKLRTRSKTPREIALLFAPAFPNELCWRVLEYWNPRY